MSHRHIALLAHNVRSLWNVGSFFRTCDAMGVERIYLTGYTPHPPRKEITKVALGADSSLLWEHHEDPRECVDSLRSEGWQIVSLELRSDAQNLSTFMPNSNVCLIVGHELAGIPEEILNRSDAIVKIPMLGKKESLNVAVAAGIALHHLRYVGGKE